MSAETEVTGILIVDPDPMERARLTRALEARGWRVWQAGDAGTAVRVYAEQRDEIRAAVVDLQLPGLQGGRVLAELAALSPSLTRLAMSADLSPYTAAAFRRLPHPPLFAKPVRVPDLDSALRAATAVTA